MIKNQQPSLSKTFSLVALLSVVSKVIGLLRDIVVAAAYGTSILADAYNYAYLFTGNILILFGGLGGPFHSATVTTLTPKRNEPEAGTLVAQICLFTAIALTVIGAAMFFLAPSLMHLVAGNYGSCESDRLKFFSESIMQLRVMSPLVLLSGVIGITYGVLNVYNRILWPSLSPAIASLAIIAAIVISHDKDSSLPLAIGTVIGAFGQLFAQVPGMFSVGLNYRFQLKLAADLAKYVKVLWPAIISTSIGQLIIYVDSFFCSRIGEGAWTAINNSNRLVQLPLGVLITAMLVPMLPRFTELVNMKKFDNLKSEFRRSLSFLWFLALPMTAILLALPQPIIRLLFQRGAFNNQSTDLVTAALVYLVPSIVFYMARDLITRIYFAFHDSLTPFCVAMVAIFVKIFLDWLLVIVFPLGVAGISISTSLITIFNLSLLAFLLRPKLGLMGFTKMLKPVLVMTFASLLCYGLTIYSYSIMQTHFASMSLVPLALKIFVATAFGGIVYLIAAHFFRIDEAKLLWEKLNSRG
jgi:putative peptidoglycan lipid II flippase